jgi:hypothetical protein
MFATLKELSVLLSHQGCLNTMFKQVAVEPWTANRRRSRTLEKEYIRTLSTFCLQYILCAFIPVPYMNVGFHRCQFGRTDVEGAYYAVSTMH